LTNKIYVANRCNPGANTAEIDGKTDSTVTIPSVISYNVAANSITNTIYVSSRVTNEITVIGEANNATATITLANTGLYAGAIAINPVTNMIYAGSDYSVDSFVIVINGATNTVTKYITTGLSTEPNALAVNTVTNKIYVGNVGGEPSIGGNIINVIDGATNTATAISLGTNAANYLSESYQAIAINQVTDKIYVANQGSGVSIINGANNAITTLNLASPFAIAINSLTNRIYVTNWNNSEVYVIGGNAASVSPVSPRFGTSAIGYNGLLAVYSLSGRLVLKTSFVKAAAKEAVLNAINKSLAVGVYKYRFLNSRKIMDEGSFVIK
jgi:DNA-binding beta-propeller fold protein YncE